MVDPGTYFDTRLLDPNNEASLVLREALADLRIPLLSWLTPDHEDGPLLLIGSGPHPLTTEINWGQPVHALVENNSQRQTLAELSACTSHRDIVINSWHPGERLPYADDVFAGAILMPFGQSPSPAELTRVLGSDSFVLSTNTKLQYPGFRSTRRWTLQYDKTTTLRLFDHSRTEFIETGKQLLVPHLRHLPTGLLSKLMRTDIICHCTRPVETKLDRVIQQSQQRQTGRRLVAMPPIIQVKEKMTVCFTDEGDAATFLKIPLTRRSAHGLETAAKMLSQLQSTLPNGHLLRQLSPSSVTLVEATSGQAWLETACNGVPLASISDASVRLQIASDIARLVRLITDLGPDNFIQPKPGPFTLARQSLINLITTRKSELSATLDHIFALLDAEEASSHLRKGDFSLNNVLVHDGVISGLIDWDECGTTKLPLANLADFIMSWMWHVEKMPRAKSLDILLSGEYGVFDSGLDIQHLLEIAGGTKRDLALGTLESWSDHIYHELKYLYMRARPKRIETLLTHPLEVIGQHLSSWTE